MDHSTIGRRFKPGPFARPLNPSIFPCDYTEEPWDDIRALLVGLRDRTTSIETRLAHDTDAPNRQPSDSAFSIKQASTAVNLSESHLRRAIYKGDLPASNVGSKARPLWRISQRDLIAWMDARKGGDPKIPPRSDLKGLIDRHLPGLRGRKDSATR
jgi:hypothetical protein